MMPPTIVLGLLLALVAAGLGYAGARNQRLTVAGGPRPALCWASAAGLAGSLLLLLGWFGPATAVFAWLTVAMLAWSVLPLLVAWWRRPRGNAE